MTRFGAAALVLLLLLAAAGPCSAQCAMCYKNAAAQDARAQQSLNLGILFLLTPPVSIMGAILFTAFRYRNGGGSRNREDL